MLSCTNCFSKRVNYGHVNMKKWQWQVMVYDYSLVLYLDSIDICFFFCSGMMCTLCIRHQCRPVRCAVGAAPWVDVPCTWITRDSLNGHQKAGTHMEAKQLEANRLAPRNIMCQLEAMNSLQKMAWISAFKNLYWLMKRSRTQPTISHWMM